MALHRLSLIVHRSPSEFLLALQPRPPMPAGDEYVSYLDSDLLDLPSALLHPIDGGPLSDVFIGNVEAFSDNIDIRAFDVRSAMEKALSQVGFCLASIGDWELSRYVEEAEFGPGPPVNTVFIRGKLVLEEPGSNDLCRWVDIPNVLKLLTKATPCQYRIGPLVSIGLIYKSTSASMEWEVPLGLQFQEYPPGVTVIPMRSKTANPYWTTNLVVVVPNRDAVINDFSSFSIYGDALLVDPGCSSKYYSQLEDIVSALPRKLVVLVTHHHHDHTDGLSVIQRCNPDALLLAHERTLIRISKDKWSIGHKPVCGGEIICIGGQQLEVIFTPGHTDGHMALHHVGTNTLIVGDHCVGQGSALLDVTAGGNLKDYFQTTYKLLELSPHAIIPMHGAVNVWPRQMLCNYLKHRRDRELSILNAIENGARTLYDIVSKAYANVDVNLWAPASSNVRIHVDHLACQGMLPKEFSLNTFRSSFDEFFAELGVAKADA